MFTAHTAIHCTVSSLFKQAFQHSVTPLHALHKHVIVTSSDSYQTWAHYIKPLVDKTVRQKLLDFIDFHFNSSNTNIAVRVHCMLTLFFVSLASLCQGLLNSVETTISYARAKYAAYLPVAITKMSFNVENRTNISAYHNNCTIPLLLSTFALFKYPNSIISRMLSNRVREVTLSLQCYCTGSSQQESSCGSVLSRLHSAPEGKVYYLLGKLVNGTRLRADVRGYPASSCSCHEMKSTGDAPVLGEVITTARNITIALLNKCSCKIPVKLKCAIIHFFFHSLLFIFLQNQSSRDPSNH